MNKPGPLSAKPLSALLGGTLSEAFAKQGFASRELVTRWAEIAGPEIAAHAEPIKLQWIRPVEGQPQEPATLILRVEGPMALEIQHMSSVILDRVNRFFGWSAVGKLALRQAPLSRRPPRKGPKLPDPAAVAREAELTRREFDVQAEGKPVDYAGRMVKRGPLTADDYVRIEPHTKAENTVDITHAYAWPAGSHAYTLGYDGSYLADIAKLDSPTPVKVERAAFFR